VVDRRAPDLKEKDGAFTSSIHYREGLAALGATRR